MTSDWVSLRGALAEAGVGGVEDLGHFVNDTRYLKPSAFDERAAMPVLLEALPTIEDGSLVATVAAHLARPWAKGRAFPALRDAFVKWAERDSNAGWQLGAAMARTADPSCGETMVELAIASRYGTSRQMVVDALWRFKGDRTASALLQLIQDPDVALHAMSALRRLVGNEAALPHLVAVQESHENPQTRWQATQHVKRARKALNKADASG